MFRLLFKQFHTIKIKESNLFFPVSRITLEAKEERNHDEATQTLAHSKALIPDLNQT